ncbi:NAD(P)H-dependent glycerol-3-phosphate dehydrogenase [Flectobacillus roseus]
MKIAIVGAGTFGTAVSNALKYECNILLHSRNQGVVEEINSTRRNTQYFPNKILSEKIIASCNDEDLLDADVLFICIPSKFVVDFILNLQLKSSCLIVNGAKGFGRDSELINECLRRYIPNRVVSLKGPSFANEMIFEIPTSFTIASEDYRDFEFLSNLFRREVVLFDYFSDVSAVELLSIAKNIYAIIIGIVDAYYNSCNVRFLAFTKAVKEIKLILGLLGLDEDSFYTFAGIGDLGLTSLNDLSRNRTLGLLIGKGFINQNESKSVVLEGAVALKHLIKLVPNFAEQSLTLIQNLEFLFDGKLDTKQFINNIIYK